ncbi:MAG: nuclear transport factor 2 family protein [Chloroflexi bacterium]|nr:nuclear transport factor 2 family protein [Chloroflexota bacterium]
MNANEQLIHDFYTAFQNKDGAAMAACYHPDITFSDPVFVGLKGEQAGAMWRMLTERGKDLEITFNNVWADDLKGKAHWEATYTFSRTGRTVHNIIDASFHFQDGKIIEHVDHFSFWRWSRQALGMPGLLLGWTPFFQKAVQKQTRGMLGKYME